MTELPGTGGRGRWRRLAAGLVLFAGVAAPGAGGTPAAVFTHRIDAVTVTVRDSWVAIPARDSSSNGATTFQVEARNTARVNLRAALARATFSFDGRGSAAGSFVTHDLLNPAIETRRIECASTYAAVWTDSVSFSSLRAKARPRVRVRARLLYVRAPAFVGDRDTPAQTGCTHPAWGSAAAWGGGTIRPLEVVRDIPRASFEKRTFTLELHGRRSFWAGAGDNRYVVEDPLVAEHTTEWTATVAVRRLTEGVSVG